MTRSKSTPKKLTTIPRIPFKRLVAEISQKYGAKIHFAASAINALQLVSEKFISELMNDAYDCAQHAKRHTVMPSDLHLAVRLRGLDVKWGEKKYRRHCNAPPEDDENQDVECTPL
jgi:histone H3